jgi:NAD(P)-dependent dehydrogenase (short-subunit alcohol dehydrogenase family)
MGVDWTMVSVDTNTFVHWMCDHPRAEIGDGLDRAGGLQMTDSRKTAIVTGASRGIGAGVVSGLSQRGYCVVANSRDITRADPFAASANLALVDGDIADPGTAAKITEAAVSQFGRIDLLINNAGVNVRKDFTDYTAEDLRSIVSVNIEGFLFITQLTVKQMLAQGSGGCIVTITASTANHPIAGVHLAVPMLTKGGLEAVTKSLAMEYVQQGIRVNAVAPSVVNRPSYKDDWKEFVNTFQPMARIPEVKDIVDAVLYLTDAGQVTGEVLHVDGGAHVGKW